MTLLATLLPLLNFLLMVIFSRQNAVHWKHLAAVVIVNMTLLLAALLFFFTPIAEGSIYTSNVGNWLLSGLFEVNWVFSIDALTYTMLLVVLTVSTLVHLYSTEYMSEDPHTARFISYLSLFTFFMLLLVTANNFVGLFLGWEGVGLCSYLLISFWFTRVQANKAAIKAMVVNRVSDLFFTVGILIIFYTFQTVEFNTVFGLAPYVLHSTLLFGGYAISPVVLITGLLFLGAMGKSAQIGLHTWLPDAMEGWRYLGLSSQKILPYAGITSIDTLVSSSPWQESVEKSSVNEVNPQETDIQLTGSSETLRKTPRRFNFTAFSAETPPPRGTLISDLEWLIGFTEGDGSFIVNNTGYVSFQVTQSHADVHVLHRVRRILGFGAVSSQDVRNNAWRFRVCDRGSLRKIILLFNGNIVLEKNRMRFCSFVTAFNARYAESIEVVPSGPDVTLKTGWFSGFTDAAGCFTVSAVDRPTQKKPYQVRVRYVLAQKGAEKELRALSTLLGGKVSFLKSYGGHSLSVQLTYLKPVLHYFRVFPLKTIKRVSLLKFLTVYKQALKSVAQKCPLSLGELRIIRKRAKEINKIATSRGR